MSKNEEGFSTKAIHAGQDPSQWSHSSVVTPIVMSSTFRQDGPGECRGFEYGRSGNPTRNALEKCLAALENGKYASTFSSGLGAVTTITSLLKAGDHLISSDDMYSGTKRLLQKCLFNQDISTTFVNVTNVKNFMTAVQPNTKMIWLESPTNPMLQIADIKAIVEATKSKNPDIIVVVDNTFLTCYFQKPLELGADIVMYSLTKYMNGHLDVIMGAAITNREDLAKKISFSQNALGCIPSPFECSLVIRGLKTLELRMQQHMKNGLAVAKFLEAHPLVEKVFHPYLPSHPQHDIALRQSSGHSGMVTFYIKGDTKKFLKALKTFTLAGSLGGTESLVALPRIMTHSSVPDKMKDLLGYTSQLIRLSIGLETEKDLLLDLDQALKFANK